MTTVEERLACLLSKAHMSPADDLFARELIMSSAFSWDQFWQIADFNQIYLLVFSHLSRLNIFIARSERIDGAIKLNMLRRSNFLRVLKDLNANSIPIYLLKGFLLGELVYNNPSYKKMNDIDILIPPDFVSEAVRIFTQHGYYFAAENLLTNNAIDFRLHHSPPLINSEGNTIIGLHWGLSSPRAKRHPTTDIFSGELSIIIDNFCARMLSYEHNLLHLCIHLPFFKIGLRELSDVANLGSHAIYNNKINWSLFLETARKWRALDSVYRVFRLSNAVIPWMNCYLKKEMLLVEKRLSSSPYVRDTNARLKNSKFLLRSRSSYVGRIEKQFILFKLSTRYKDKALHLNEQYRLFFNIPLEEKKRLIFSNSFYSKISYKSSRALWFALAQDLGNIFLIIITLDNIWSLFKHRLKLFWQKEEAPDPKIDVFRTYMEHIE